MEDAKTEEKVLGRMYEFNEPGWNQKLVGTLEEVEPSGLCAMRVGLTVISGIESDLLREVDSARFSHKEKPLESRYEVATLRLRLTHIWSSVSGQIVAISKVSRGRLLLDIRSPDTNRLTGYGPFRSLSDEIQIGSHVEPGHYLGELETEF